MTSGYHIQAYNTAVYYNALKCNNTQLSETEKATSQNIQFIQRFSDSPLLPSLSLVTACIPVVDTFEMPSSIKGVHS